MPLIHRLYLHGVDLGVRGEQKLLALSLAPPIQNDTVELLWVGQGESPPPPPPPPLLAYIIAERSVCGRMTDRFHPSWNCEVYECEASFGLCVCVCVCVYANKNDI